MKYLNRDELAEALRKVLLEASESVVQRFSGGGAYEDKVSIMEDGFLGEVKNLLERELRRKKREG